jgi:hypothetical protein
MHYDYLSKFLHHQQNKLFICFHFILSALFINRAFIILGNEHI